MNYNSLNAIIYEFLWQLCELYPSLRGNKWVRMVMAHCFPDWVLAKTETTMADVDSQTEEIKEQWQKEDNQKVVEKVSKLFPEAKVTTHDEKTGAVLIEHPPDGSKAQELLGGAMEIRSPWSLPEDK
jgi:hypothetical protein